MIEQKVRSLSEVKTGSGLKITLVVVSTLFVISLIANVYLYTRQYGGITPDSGLENQIASLQDEIADLESAKLIKVNFHGTDNRPLFQTPYMHITGEVVNVGTHTAYNCKLHVILKQREVVAEDTYIIIGTIVGEGSATVDSKIYYNGETPSVYQASLEWD